MEGVFIPIVVFLLVYAAISFELINKAVAALLGVMILLVLHVIDEHTAVEFIDFETIMLLLGMMTIVAILRKSGFFTIVSVKIAELTKGSPLKILVLFSIVTAILSAFLDNVTTVLIVIPIIIELTAGMGLDPKVYVISQAIISNIVGLCHINKVPVYLFANSLKFSFHPSSSQRIHTKTVPTFQDDVSCALTTHSHDIVDLKLVDHLVTEDGKIEKPFMEKYLQ